MTSEYVVPCYLTELFLKIPMYFLLFIRVNITFDIVRAYRHFFILICTHSSMYVIKSIFIHSASKQLMHYTLITYLIRNFVHVK